jgi:hypothetical protein
VYRSGVTQTILSESPLSALTSMGDDASDDDSIVLTMEDYEYMGSGYPNEGYCPRPACERRSFAQLMMMMMMAAAGRSLKLARK